MLFRIKFLIELLKACNVRRLVLYYWFAALTFYIQFTPKQTQYTRKHTNTHARTQTSITNAQTHTLTHACAYAQEHASKATLDHSARLSPLIIEKACLIFMNSLLVELFY